eukprot:349732-Chlamydomonas_euryale.AAC.1
MDDENDTQIDSTLYTESFTSIVLSTPVEFNVQVRVSFGASIDFTFLGRSYTFRVWRTGGRSNDKFIKGFHSYMPRDTEVFGSIGSDASGALVVRMSTDQKTAAVVHACKDIAACLDKILTVHMTSVMDYALWYREEHPEDNDYSSLISLITCHCIVHAEFMSSRVPRQIVKF